jgi:dynein heavy chain 2
MSRTYDTWTPEYISKGGNVVRSQALFSLAWLHAVLQERRMYIPQGWTKFYEFSLADLRVGADIIDRLCAGGEQEEINQPTLELEKHLLDCMHTPTEIPTP